MTNQIGNSKFETVVACRLGVLAAWVLALLLVAGCRSDTTASKSEGSNVQTPFAVPDARPLGGDRHDLPPPAGLEGRRVLRHEAAAMERATMTLEAILSTLEKPSYLTPSDRAEDRAAERDLPLPAQRAYVAGRNALHNGQAYQAIQYLSAADRLAPNHPQILRLLAQANFGSGVRARGAHYLAQVVAVEPNDVVSLYYLGRHALEEGQWGKAIVTLAHALSLRDKVDHADPGIWPLMHYFLGAALENDRYDHASLQAFRTFLQATTAPNANTRFSAELSVLQRQATPTWLAVGDTYCRLGDPASALQAYRQALAVDDTRDMQVLRRIVYAQMRLGQLDAAAQFVIEALAIDPRPTTLELVAYIHEHGVSSAQLASPLQTIYRSSDRPSFLALAAAEHLPRPQAVSLLVEHLDDAPADEVVFRQAMALLLSEGSSTSDVLAALFTAQKVRGRVSPTLNARYVSVLFDTVGDPAKLVAAIDAAGADERQALRQIKGMALRKLGRSDEALELYQAILAQSPDDRAARVELVQLLFDEEQYAEAMQALDAAPNDADDLELLQLRARTLAKLGRADEALALLDRLLDRQPANVELATVKADLLLAREDYPGAERTLLEVLRYRADAESVYLKLRDLYSEGVIADSQSRQAALNDMALRSIPNSRMARLVRVDRQISSGDLSAAAAMLRQLVEEDPADERSFLMLVQIYYSTNRRDDCDELMAAQLRRFPNERRWLSLATDYYALTEQYEPLAATLMTMLERKLHPMPEVAVAQYAFCVRELQQEEAGDAFLKKVANLYPDIANDIHYLRASVHMRRDTARTEAILAEVLASDPKHAAANNDLGYYWAERGEKLEAALKMTKIAVEAEPDNGNYRDSLGWAYYKLGRFDEAVAELSRAVNDPRSRSPVILEHLGDALYRAGRNREAADVWRSALELIQIDRRDTAYVEDQQTLDCEQRLREKRAAVTAKQEPPTSPVPSLDNPSKP